MANEELAMRFSDKTYASKSEVSRTLKISQIDTIWSNILSYRSHFTRVLEIRNIDRTPFFLVFTPTMSTRINEMERKLTKAMIKYTKLADNDLTKYEIHRENGIRCLKTISHKYSLMVSDEQLANIFMQNISSLTPSDMILSRYSDGLRHIEKYYDDPINEDLLVKLYSLVSGNNEIVSLYRTEDLSGSSKAIIDRIYNSAPSERIEAMMKDLLSFLNDDNYSFFVRAVCAYYYIQYIKPFDCYSEEIGLLVMKDILAHNELESLAAIIELESLLINDAELSSIILEVQKTNDLTYLLNYVLNKFVTAIDDLYERIIKCSAREIEHEFFKEESKEEKVEVVKEEPKESSISQHIDFEVKVALPLMPRGLDEKDAQQIEQSLLEMNPNLKRGEAHFYARHCTIGKYYTIQQYKKSLDCAYETARTSMDRLVYEGYYRKEMVKNKFVYTPIPRK